MDLNQFAREVARLEKGKKQVSIAQIKEIIRIMKGLIQQGTGVNIYILIQKAL